MSKTNGSIRPQSFGDILNRASPQAEYMREFAQHVVNATLLSRQEMIRGLSDPRRNIEDECGHPGLGTSIPSHKFQQLYERDSIAARIVDVFPKECWQVQPTVYEDESPEVTTKFEEAWRLLGQQLMGEESWHDEERGSPVWEILQRGDKLSGIGRYGIILLGLDDGKEYREPATPTPGQKLLFIRVFPESLAQITRYESDSASPRFGKPTAYTVTLNDPSKMHGGTGLSTQTVEVHWSRVIHLADNLDTSEVFGAARMEAVVDRILDLRKLYGGSAEMYWKGAFPGYTWETHPSLGGDVEVDVDEMRNTMENFFNGLQRYTLGKGMSMRSLAPQVVDPTPQINVQIEAICIKLGVPIRVFKGSERGELASSQDDAAWNDRLRERQQGYITPRIIVPFVNRLIALGILPRPKRYSVWWPNLASQTDQEKSSVALQRTQAMAQYVGAGVSTIINPIDFFTLIIGLSEEEARSVGKNAEAYQEESTKDMLETEAEVLDEEAGLIEVADANGKFRPIDEAPGVKPGGNGGGKSAKGNSQLRGTNGVRRSV